MGRRTLHAACTGFAFGGIPAGCHPHVPQHTNPFLATLAITCPTCPYALRITGALPLIADVRAHGGCYLADRPKIHVYCTGPPANSGLSTFVLESGGGSPSASMFGIQEALKKLGRRSAAATHAVAACCVHGAQAGMCSMWRYPHTLMTCKMLLLAAACCRNLSWRERCRNSRKDPQQAQCVVYVVVPARPCRCITDPPYAGTHALSPGSAALRLVAWTPLPAP